MLDVHIISCSRSGCTFRGGEKGICSGQLINLPKGMRIEIINYYCVLSSATQTGSGGNIARVRKIIGPKIKRFELLAGTLPMAPICPLVHVWQSLLFVFLFAFLRIRPFSNSIYRPALQY